MMASVAAEHERPACQSLDAGVQLVEQRVRLGKTQLLCRNRRPEGRPLGTLLGVRVGRVLSRRTGADVLTDESPAHPPRTGVVPSAAAGPPLPSHWGTPEL